MKRLGIVILMAVAVAAYKDRRGLEDFPPYQEVNQHPPFHEQHQPFREQPFKSQYQSYRQRPYRQDFSSYDEQLPFKDRPVFKDYPSANIRQFYGDSASFRDSPDLKKQTPFFVDGPSFRDQSSFKNEQVLDQSLNDQYSYQRPSFRDDFRFSDFYDKPSSGYKGQEQPGQATPFTRDSEYLKHGNHGLGYASVPPISPYENALPLNEDTSTTTAPSTAATTTHKSSLPSTVSAANAAITQVHTSVTSEPKTVSHSATMPSVKSDTVSEIASSQRRAFNSNDASLRRHLIPPLRLYSQKFTCVALLEGLPRRAHWGSSNPIKVCNCFQLAEGAATGTSAPTAATMAAATAKQSTLAQAALTTSLPIVATESPILSFGRQTLPPIEFQAGKFTAPASYYVTSGLKGKLQQSLLGYLLSQQAKTAIKSNDQSSMLSYALPDVLNSSLNNKIQGQPLNYVLPEESKAALKDNLLNYLLQPEPNRGLSFPQSSLSETVNYIPLNTALAERPKITLPTLPIATLSAISRPLQTLNYASPTLPKVPTFIAQDTSSGIPLGMPGEQELFDVTRNVGREIGVGVGERCDMGAPRDKLCSSGIPADQYCHMLGQNVFHRIACHFVPEYHNTAGNQGTVLGKFKLWSWAVYSFGLCYVKAFHVFASETALPTTLGSTIPIAQSTSIFNSLPSGMSGMSSGIASSITPALPVSIPTLNLGQNFQHIGQVRQFEAARSQPLSYSTGLQMQLGDFGGMDYALRSSNQVSRPLELGIAKVGLSLPEMSRQQFPTFSKVGLEQHMW
ncbi:uncharacterized protein LOC143181384 [Calliopsis andreniformis]|uniref:uncharacterized protein LOC143181384 n=1 Tax=Calliopsis andreniformis TaxID=337506 RepID=UPI003FCC2BC2